MHYYSLAPTNARGTLVIGAYRQTQGGHLPMVP